LSHNSDPARQHHYDVERHLVDAEISLADSLERLSAAEERIGLDSDADHRLEQAAELQDRARNHADHLREELEHEGPPD
jgi:bifunctional DNA-binding transcriptional regulator/antitoxin component of YhaV-PrlF toxin-antitoxin module